MTDLATFSWVRTHRDYCAHGIGRHGLAMELSWRNPQLVAAQFSVALCAATRRQLLTILSGLVVFLAGNMF